MSMRLGRAAILALALGPWAGSALAQDLTLFPRDDFGTVVLSHRQFAGELEAAIQDYNNEPIDIYSENAAFVRMGRAVGRLDILTDAGVAPCTAFLIAPDQLLTNWHCVPGLVQLGQSPGTTIEAVSFVAGYTQQGVVEGAEVFAVNPEPLEANQALDYAILAVDGAPGERFGVLPLARRQIDPGDPFWIIGHPMGEAQRISREQCRAASPAVSGLQLRHTCDTLPGNSGSPVIDASAQEVIALHHAGSHRDQVNFAIPMSLIVDQSELLSRLEGRESHLVLEESPEAAAAALWERIGESGGPALLRDLIERYPGTLAAQLAAQKLDTLEVALAAARDCDLLAAIPGNPDNPAGIAGIDFGQIDSTRAIAECLNAVRRNPQELRQSYQLARAYLKADLEDPEPLKMFQDLSAAGYGPATSYLGVFAQNGIGTVERDPHEALRLFTLSTEQGYPVGHNRLGWLLHNGPEIVRDYRAAEQHYLEAAAAGVTLSNMNLGVLYSAGPAELRDYDAAHENFVIAAEAGNIEAVVNLGALFAREDWSRQDFRQSIAYYTQAAEAGDRIAMRNLGRSFEEGRGMTAPDLQKALDWYRKAANLGHPQAWDDVDRVQALLGE